MGFRKGSNSCAKVIQKGRTCVRRRAVLPSTVYRAIAATEQHKMRLKTKDMFSNGICQSLVHRTHSVSHDSVCEPNVIEFISMSDVCKLAPSLPLSLPLLLPRRICPEKYKITARLVNALNVPPDQQNVFPYAGIPRR